MDQDAEAEPCKVCGGPNDMGELCPGCAEGNDPFPHADTSHQLDRR